MALEDFPKFIRTNYEIHEWRHASAILEADFLSEYRDLCDVLIGFRVNKSQLVIGGGRKSDIAGWVDAQFYAKGWKEKHFDTKIVVDTAQLQSPASGLAPPVSCNNRILFSQTRREGCKGLPDRVRTQIVL